MVVYGNDLNLSRAFARLNSFKRDMCEIKRKKMKAFGFDGYLREQAQKEFERHELENILAENGSAKVSGYYDFETHKE